VRKGTQAFVSIVSLGLIAAGYQAGLAAEVSSGFSAAPVGSTAGTTSASGSGTLSGATNVANTSAGSESLNTPASDDGASTSTATSAPATSPATKASPKATTPAAASTPKATTAAPAPASTPKATTPAPSTGGSAVTKTGTAIAYRYGTVQVSVTKASGKITAVNLLQEGATGGRQGAFPYLVDYAIQANGSSFGNLGGATYTTDAFKQSLESALAKF
jgi:uncharacterized protein with FMN-binding domain